MKKVFADTCYWIALLNPKDRLHVTAMKVTADIGACRIVTSEMVLTELLNAFSKYDSIVRKAVIEMIRNIERNPNIEIIPQTSLQFRSAVERYASRLDKNWGLTDCASFILMEERGMTEVLTGDRHFTQSGFKILM